MGRATDWVWELEGLSVNLRVLLLYVAKLTDKAGSQACVHPPLRTMAARTGLSPSTLRRTLHLAQHMGYLVMRERRDEQGGDTFNCYELEVRQGGPPSRVDPPPPPIYDPKIDLLREDLRDRYIPGWTPLQPDAAKQTMQRRRPETPWPDDLALTPEMRAYATSREVDPDREFAKWRNDCDAHDRRYRNWPAAWRSRIDHAVDWGTNRPVLRSVPNRPVRVGPTLPYFEDVMIAEGRGDQLREIQAKHQAALQATQKSKGS